MTPLARDELERQIVALAPLHIDVQVTPEVSTGVARDASPDAGGGADVWGPVSHVRPHSAWKATINRIYPNGLEGRRFLDCACNCGAYSFWAKELGASDCFGFDAREHWINQARFLLENRSWPSDGIRFEVQDLYDLKAADLEPFEVTMFQGIFYHLPDPVAGLKLAADLTSELLILDTAARAGLPDGMLAIAEESKTRVMSGVHGLAWFPTGPEVLTRILSWLGFPVAGPALAGEPGGRSGTRQGPDRDRRLSKARPARPDRLRDRAHERRRGSPDATPGDRKRPTGGYRRRPGGSVAREDERPLGLVLGQLARVHSLDLRPQALDPVLAEGDGPVALHHRVVAAFQGIRALVETLDHQQVRGRAVQHPKHEVITELVQDRHELPHSRPPTPRRPRRAR